MAAYLATEVLARQPEPIRTFLLLTSVLRQLTGPLCDAVTGDSGSAAVLEQVERKSLFLTRAPDDGAAFRYHRLFRDLLRRELRTDHPGRERELLLRAANWHLADGDAVAAAEYAIEAEDWDLVLDLVARHGRAFFEQGRSATVLHWLESVPSALRADRPLVELQEAVLNTMAGSTHMAAEVLERLAHRSVPPGLPDRGRWGPDDVGPVARPPRFGHRRRRPSAGVAGDDARRGHPRRPGRHLGREPAA